MGDPADASGFLASGLRKRFGAVTALADARLETSPGEVHGLIGENGAGKSTLIRIATGLERADSGALSLVGKPYAPASPTDAAAAGVRVVSQDFALAPNISVAENLALGSPEFLRACTFGHFPWRRARSWARERLDAAGIRIDPGARVGDLTVSQRQLVALVRGVVDNPRVVFLDEPSSALDQVGLESLFRLVRDLRDGGTSVIYVSHKLEEIFELTDRVTVMRDGVTVADGIRTAEASEHDLIATMVGREVNQLFPPRPRTGRAGPVVLRLRGLWAPGVNDVDLDVRAGEILGLGGLVGAGRTELAKAVSGLAPILKGDIEIDGKRIVNHDRHEALANGIEYATEDRMGEGLVLGRPLSENITSRILPRFRRGLRLDHASARAFSDSQMEQFNILAKDSSVRVAALSGGNQQKALLASCLASMPSVVFLDEPTRGVDVGAKAQIYELIRELTSDRAVVVISSELLELLGLADRIVIMHDGRCVAEFDPTTATEADLVSAAFGRG